MGWIGCGFARHRPLDHRTGWYRHVRGGWRRGARGVDVGGAVGHAAQRTLWGLVIPRWFPNAPYLLVLTTVGALGFWSLLGMVFLVAVDELTTYLSLQQLAVSG